MTARIETGSERRFTGWNKKETVNLPRPCLKRADPEKYG